MIGRTTMIGRAARCSLALCAAWLLSTGMVEAAEALTPNQLDDMIVAATPDGDQRPADDARLLRRLSFDLVGRPPTPDEIQQFVDDDSANKYAATVDRLLASDEFGINWANYWSDAISYRVPPPELTFLSYAPLKTWLADQINSDTPWDETVRAMLTVVGTVRDRPAATFVGYHQGNAVKLGAETARLFLGLQLRCAQCHDHPFADWRRDQFHGLAAFFARVSGDLGKVQDGTGAIVKAKAKGEHMMPDLAAPDNDPTPMVPVLLDGQTLEAGTSDATRRARLAEWVTAADNPWFARAFVNRVWARLMGRGFVEPVDDLESALPIWVPEAHRRLADAFVASGYDTKALFRLITATRAYRGAASPGRTQRMAGEVQTEKLRGDEVFASLVAAIGLPNVCPEQVKPTAEIRFPPPPKSTRDLVDDRFGYDPSRSPDEVPGTMLQALFLMNNDQLHAQLRTGTQDDTLLSRLLAEIPDDRALTIRLFQQVLARAPTEREIEIAVAHVARAASREEAYADIVWGLINSAEFVIRR